jgi:hypothetical protein
MLGFILSWSVISWIYFSWTVMSKKYFSPTVMRPLSLAHCSVSVNVCKQTTREMPEATCTRSTIVDYLHEKPLIWGVILWLVYFHSLHIYKTIILINAKYMINIIFICVRTIFNWCFLMYSKLLCLNIYLL